MAGAFLSILGAAFHEAVPLLRILVVGQLTFNAFGPGGFTLIMTGHEALAAKIIAAGAMILGVLTLSLTAWLGAMGAAYATAIGMTLTAALLAIGAWRPR